VAFAISGRSRAEAEIARLTSSHGVGDQATLVEKLSEWFAGASDGGNEAMLGPTPHIDTFARDKLPPPDQWADFRLHEFDYPEYLNAAVELTDRIVERGFGDRTALIGHGRHPTYKELADWSNRLARALIEDYGVKAGNRVLIRSANNPAMIACWLAATKAGAVVVNTMPMLRTGELTKIVDKAEIKLALCDTRILDELVACAKESRSLKSVVGFDGTADHDAELDRIALNKPVNFAAVPTGRDDVALLGFTSGTTGSRSRRRRCTFIATSS
jgi:2-aminobenzoate-CoA ligase